MRIAVSGSHCTGKSTLVADFLRVHPEFIHEPEPYTLLVEEFGEEFSAEPCAEDFLRQLEFNIDRLKQHERDARVIYERCPIDFLAYIECVSLPYPLPRGGDKNQVHALEAIQSLDLIVYLPIDDTIEVSDEEFPKLRKAVDRRLSKIYREDEFGVVSSTNLLIVEATGSAAQRLHLVETAMSSKAP